MANQSNAARALDALADPTRRAVFERVADSPAAVGQIAEGLPVSRPAVSQHLRVLKEAGLVSETAMGTRRIYRIDPRGIGAMRDWLEGFWSQALDDFKAFADAQAAEGEESE
jgi:DNA-binding transcriptional ArsR family regulator